MSAALVTGASGGVGAAIAVALAQRGDHVWLVGRRRERLDATASAVERVGGHASVCETDLTDASAVARITDAIAASGAGLETLVHSAGVITAMRPVEDTPSVALDEQLAVNFRAPALLTRALLPFLTQRGGDVVFLNSTASSRGVAGSSGYAASKAALRAFADSLRDEVNGQGVRVLTVLLGRTATEMQEAVHRAEGRTYRSEYLVQPEDVAATVCAALALPRRAEITDVTIRPARRPPQ